MPITHPDRPRACAGADTSGILGGVKIFLGNPPWRKPGFYGVRAGSRWPHFEHASSRYMPFPFQLAYAAAVLERGGFEVRVVDGCAERMTDEAYLDRLASFSPDLVIHEISTISISQDLRIVEAARRRMGNRARIAVCGLHVFAFEPEFLRAHPSIDFSLIGEYELTALDLAQRLAADASVDGVPGVVYRDGSGSPRATPRRPLVRDLDSLPWPARHLLPMHAYHDTPGGIPEPSVQMWASRGCPFRCSFCAWPQIVYGSRAYRTRDPVRVVDEMEHLVREKGFRSVYFDDDTFNIGRERVLAICREIIRRRLEVPWAAMARADLMDHEMLRTLKEAGLRALKYGVESVDQGILDRCGKELDLRKTEARIRETRRLGILYHLTFTFGLPGETRETIRRSLAWCLRMDPDTVQFSVSTPFPGSRFYDELEARGQIASRNWEEYDGFFHAVVKTESLGPEEILEERNAAARAWEEHVRRRMRRRKLSGYLRPRYAAAALRSPGKALRKLVELGVLKHPR